MFYFMMPGYMFGINCQTTLQVQEKLTCRLPVEIYVQLRCYRGQHPLIPYHEQARQHLFAPTVDERL